MADIKYGGDKAGYEDALNRFRAQEAAATDQAAAQKRLGEAEAESARASGQNIGARKGATTVIADQAAAIEASAAALQRETALLTLNTRAWAASVEARRGAGAAAALAQTTPAVAAGRSTQVGYSDSLAQFRAQELRAEAGRAAALDAANAAAVQATASSYLASRGLSGAGEGGTSAAGRALGYVQGGETPAEAATREAVSRQRVEAIDRAAASTAAARQPLPVAPVEPYGLGVQTYTKEQSALIAADRTAKESLAGVETQLSKTNAAWRLSTAETAAASQAMVRHGALSTEFIQSLARGEVTLQEFGGALTATIGKFAGWAVAGGLVYGAFEALKEVVKGATETQRGVAELERVQIPGYTRGAAEAGLRETASRVNVPIHEVAQAQLFAARAGFNRSLPEAQSAGETATLAFKLDEVPVQEAARGLGAVKVAFGLNAQQIRQVFNELDVGQLKFNARLQQTLPYLGRSSAAFAADGGTITQLVRQIVEVTGAVPGGGGGGGSGSAATFFTRLAGNLRRPSAQETLSSYGFNPSEGVGYLLESIQRAASRGVTPSGAKLELVSTGTKDLTPGQQNVFKLAEALSGGPALAGRFGIQVLNAAITGRAAQVEGALSHSQGAANEDLQKRLGTINEQATAVGVAFANVGSEIGAAGLTSAAEDLLGVLRGVGGAAEFALGPLKLVGDSFSVLPSYLQQLLVVAGGAAVAARVGGFNLLSSPADTAYVKGAARTTSSALATQRNIVERRTGEIQSQRAEEENIAQERARFGSGRGAALYTLEPTDKRAVALRGELASIDERAATAAARSARSTELLISEQQRKLALESDEEIIQNRRVQTGQKAAILRSRGVTIAQGGLGSSLPLIGPSGELVGTANAARRNLAASPAEASAVRAGGVVLTDALATTAIGVKGSGAAVQENVKAAGVGLGEALKLSGAQVRQGGEELALGLQQIALNMVTLGRGGALSLGEGGKVARGGIGEIFGGGGLAAGSLGSRIGQNALKGLGYAFIGSALSEIGGQAIGGKAGELFSGAGGKAAFGAGLGALIGPEGAIAGGIIGGGIGLAEGLFGKTPKAREKEAKAQEVELQKLKEGAAKNKASIEGQSAEFSEQLEKSTEGETEAAVKAREKAAAVIKKLGAQAEAFAGLPQGKEAQEAIGKAIAESWTRLVEAETPGQREVLAGAHNEAVEAAGKAADKQLKLGLAFATSPGERSAAVGAALGPLRTARTEARENRTANEELLEAAEEQLAKDKKGRPTSHKTESVAADKQAIDELRKRIEAVKAGEGNLSKELALKESELAEVNVKFEQGIEKSYSAHEEQEVGANPEAKRKVRERAIENQRKAEAPLQHGTPEQQTQYNARQEERNAEQEKIGEERAKEAADERVKYAEADAKKEAAQAGPFANQSALAAIRVAGATAKLNALKSERGNQAINEKALNLEIEDGETAVLEAQNARAQAVQSEAQEIASLQGQIAQARDVGNPRAQANDAIAAADAMIGLAKNEKERLQGQLALLQGLNQLQQAAEEEISEIGALKESTEINPSEKTATKVATTRKNLAAAKTPQERRKYQTDLNNLLIQQEQEHATEATTLIDDRLHMHEISNATAIRELQGLLKLKDLTRAQREQIKTHIFDLQNESTRDFAVGNLRQAPTLYDAATLARSRQAAPQSLNFHDLSKPRLTQHNTIYINVAGGGHGEVVHELERAYGQVTRAQLRSAGLTS